MTSLPAEKADENHICIYFIDAAKLIVLMD